LTAGAHATLYAAEKALKETRVVILGLPARCMIKQSEGRVTLESLLPAEHDIVGYAKDEAGILPKVRISEMPNPCARGFRFLEITSKT
jgi:hypothetical protein